MAAASNIVEFPGSPSPRPPERGQGTTVMRSDLVEAASKIIPEPPVLINLVSRRVKQLNQGRSALVQVEPRMGSADIALKEIIEGKIAPEFLEGTVI
jgi:DNA-directed RNA polymerase subunit omega